MLVEFLIIFFLILLGLQFFVLKKKIIEGAKNKKKSTIFKDVGKKMKDVGKPKPTPTPAPVNDDIATSSEEPGIDIKANEATVAEEKAPGDETAVDGQEAQSSNSKPQQIFKPNNDPQAVAMDVNDLKNRYMALQSEVDSVNKDVSSLASVNEAYAKSSIPQSEVTGNELPASVENASGPSHTSTFLNSL